MEKWITDMTDDPERQKELQNWFTECYGKIKHFQTLKAAVEFGVKAFKNLPKDPDGDDFGFADILLAPKDYSEGGRYCLCPSTTLQALLFAGFQTDDGGPQPRDPMWIADEKGWKF